jgi:hypothetical protein
MEDELDIPSGCELHDVVKVVELRSRKRGLPL